MVYTGTIWIGTFMAFTLTVHTINLINGQNKKQRNIGIYNPKIMGGPIVQGILETQM